MQNAHSYTLPLLRGEAARGGQIKFDGIKRPLLCSCYKRIKAREQRLPRACQALLAVAFNSPFAVVRGPRGFDKATF